MSKKYIVGIIGGISCGKTFAGRFFENLGAGFIDCDKIVHRLYDKEGLGAKKIETFFGEEFVNKDGSVNRTKLGIFVSKDEKKTRILEKIIHPVVLNELQKEIDKLDKKLIFVELNTPAEKFLNICDKIIKITSRKMPKNKPRYLLKMDKFKNMKIKTDFTVNNPFKTSDLETKLASIYKNLLKSSHYKL
jgi:dephospho-CoA kinase